MEKNANQYMIGIDSSSLAHRVKHTLKGIGTEFYDTGVMFGFMMKMYQLAKKFNTNRFFFAFDSDRNKYYRKKIYPDYKVKPQKEITEEDLILNKTCYKQLNILGKEILPAIGFKNIFRKKGYEADDIIANIVLNHSDKHKFLIHSNDEDLYQLLNHADIFKANNKLYTKKDFIEEYDIEPEYWADVKSIAGCSSDRIPGVFGIGEKKAISYLQDKCTPKIKSKIQNEEKNIKMYKQLTELPMKDMKPIKLKYDEVLDLGGFIDVCTRYNFNSFMDNGRLEDWTVVFELNNKVY